MKLKYRLLVVFLLLTNYQKAYAIRPFVTDDARVVGNGLAQVETWFNGSGSEITHNVLGAIGPTDWLEVTAGFAHGGVYHGEEVGYSITGPIFQVKTLVSETQAGGLPGLAFAAGVISPFGQGSFTPKGLTTFGYMALTESLFDEGLLLHANLGFAAADEKTHWMKTVTGGFGFQARVIGGLHSVGEIYYGDPYNPIYSSAAAQVGFRYIVNDFVQFDGTVGSNLNQDSNQWWTLGIRLVSPKLW